MKPFIFFFSFLLISFCTDAQSWYPMGDIDPIATSNGKRAVDEIGFYNNKFTIGGYFKRTSTRILNSTAQWDGNQWQPMSIGVWHTSSDDSSGGCFSLCEYRNKLFSGGTFQGAGGSFINISSHKAANIAKWNGIDWFPMTQPNDGVNSSCNALGVYNGNLYLGGFFGGSFDSSGIHGTQGIAKWNDTVFSSVGQMSGNYPIYNYDAVLDFTVYNNKLIAAGYFNSINGSPFGAYGFIAAWNDTVWSALGTGLSAPVTAITVFNGELYAGGIFITTGDGIPANHIAKWDGTQWLSVGEGLNDTILTLCVDSLNNKLIAGGRFTQTGLGQPANHLAEWTGTNWQEIGGGMNDDVWSLFAKDSNLYVGGEFTQAGGVTANLIAVWGNSPVGINEINKKDRKIKLYPNPNNGSMQLDYSLNEGEAGELKIMDVTGKLVASYSLENGKNNVQLNAHDLNNGVYLYQIIINGNLVTADKLVIIKD